MCPRFRAYLCTGGRNVPQIQDRLLHRGQKRASDSGQTFAQGQKRAPDPGQTYARGAETCLRFRADFCTVCIDVPQIQGRLLHRVHRRVPDSGQTFG